MPVGYSIYEDQPSALHQRIDPRTKLIALVAVFIVALEFNHPVVLGLMVALVLSVGLSAGISLKRFWPFLLGASWFVVLGVVIWPAYIQQGPLLFRALGVDVTLDGVLFGLAMGLRVALMVVAAGVWMMTTSPQKMTLGLLRMGLPYKAGLALSTTIRFIPFVTAERAKIMEAQRARGLRFEKGSLMSRLKSSVAVIAPMFVRSLDLTQSLATAMDARGIGARATRTSILELKLTGADTAIIVICVFAAVGGLVLRFLGVGVLVRGYL